MLHFRDPIHGLIDVTEDECAIIDTAAFQRLRRVKQLATTYMVYHGAEHTRFGHSIGVMHLTSRVFDSILNKNPDMFGNDAAAAAYYRQLLRLVGLTHDLGHSPFSHASEDLFQEGRTHEDYTREILFCPELCNAIERVNQSFHREYDASYQITPETIWLAYTGENVVHELYQSPQFPFLKSLMDSELDCDKMDYLLRDSYYCGVNYGKFDLGRLVDSFTVYRGENNDQLKLAIASDGVQAVEEFVLARYFMFIQVYFHKTRRLLDKRLVSSMKEILPKGVFPLDVKEYLEWDDIRVLSKLSTSDANMTASLFLNRETMHCVFSSKPHMGRDGQKLYDLAAEKARSILYEKGLTSKDSLNEHLVLDSPQKAVHKISPDLEDERGIPVIFEGGKKPSSLLEESMLLNSLKDNEIVIKRLYVSSEYRNDVEEALCKYL
ncbi:HD domain-containing protein [Adlercreutzia sp. ZJ138]|uniref:HD domain-containing protein n=1 Tax=Adlercreutzia sp. ZJ138 TaxID=2709405 RepID=UPI0013ED2B8A|nr:HD domain-containing protein [Adlercreutzia sp. ZJ138]